MEVQLRKLADLQIDESYYVLGYKPINSKYGDTYILICRLYSNEIQLDFQMFATELIVSYISIYSPEDKFFFTVRKNIYAEIDDYIYAEIDDRNSYFLLN